MSYTSEKMDLICQKNENEHEFLQAIREVFSSIEPVVEKNPLYKKYNILERIAEPERQIKFKVCWIDDNWDVKVNRGYRVQFNNAIGPYKGGLRFHPSVNIGIIKFLGFEQVFKNALTGLPIGGGKGGSDFDPKGKSDREIMNFCQSFMMELYRYIGPDTDVPAGDIGVGSREIGYLFGQYKKMKNIYEGTLTGKGIGFGGSFLRIEATGYGLLYFIEEMLKQKNISLKGKIVCISGSGNVAIYAAQKATHLGAKVVTMSDSTGFIQDDDGIKLDVIKEIKEVNHQRICEYIKYVPTAKYFSGKFDWSVPCDIALPCATQNEIDLKCAENLIKNKVIAVCEGANMPTTIEATELFLKNKILFAPGKAANAGGVAVSALEMSQNSIRQTWSFSEVDLRLKEIMKSIFLEVFNAAKEYGAYDNYVVGSNIAGFIKVADAMIAQGI